ncbi:purine permease 3-like [Phalaenopsis equestris]|uniref:purine permease 3-like n=1 Tax=Phalaenopsis equestris TaxID=78828 RepID=UPI0009E34737|nr:purine permease 3-like [Phalaenopsis equestris]
MDIEHHHPAPLHSSTTTTEPTKPIKSKRLLLFFNIILLLIGGSGNPLILRVYYLHGGNRKWFTSFLQVTGFPFLLLPLLFSFLRSPRRHFFLISPFLLLCSTFIGLLTGMDNFFFSYGISYLPVSTSSLLISTQLAFTAIFAFLIVKQKFRASSINAVALLTFSAVVLGVHANGDRPEGESNAKYYMGFVMTLSAAVLDGLILSLVELMYVKSKKKIGYTLVIEIQFVIGVAATAFCVVGMTISKDFQALSRERHNYGLGETKYNLIIVFNTIVTQCFFLGMVGTIKYSTALLGGVILAICIPITELLAVFFFHEKFDGQKGVAFALSLWGTASYFYGEYKSFRRGKGADTKAQFPTSCQERNHPESLQHSSNPW